MVKASVIFDWADIVSWTVALPVIVAVNVFFGLKVYGVWKKARAKATVGKKREAAKNAQVIGVMIWATTVCYTLCVSTGVLIKWLPPVPCVPFIRTGACFYLLSKVIMYTVFIFRVDKVYGDTTYAYNRRQLKALLGFCWLGAAIALPFTVTLPKGDEKQRKGITFCEITCPTWYFGLAAVGDMAVCSICLWLFTKPLQSLMKSKSEEIERSASNGTTAAVRKLRIQSNTIRKLATRYTIATWTSVCTTLFFLVTVATFKTVALMPVDMVVNSVCLGLMTNWYPQHFQALCIVPLFAARHCFRCDVDGFELELQLQTAEGTRTTAVEMADAESP